MGVCHTHLGMVIPAIGASPRELIFLLDSWHAAKRPHTEDVSGFRCGSHHTREFEFLVPQMRTGDVHVVLRGRSALSCQANAAVPTSDWHRAGAAQTRRLPIVGLPHSWCRHVAGVGGAHVDLVLDDVHGRWRP